MLTASLMGGYRAFTTSRDCGCTTSRDCGLFVGCTINRDCGTFGYTNSRDCGLSDSRVICRR